MNYEEAITYIIDRDGYEKGFVANPFLEDEEIALGLKRTEGLLERLGRPDRKYRIAHVAGTKGKGSTSAMIAAIGQANGWKTGVYATPHLHTFRERILLDGVPVSEEQFAALTEQMAEACERLVREEPEIGPPTAFEIVTAMALLGFAEAGVDLAVVEVGMGGRLDATNVVTPDVAVIASISFDHGAILGNSLAEIAGEKAGIIKPGKPVVSAAQHPDAAAVVARTANEHGAPLFIAGRDWTSEAGERVRLAGPWGDLVEVEIALAGRHQVENAGLALMACWQLDQELAGNEAAVREGLRSVVWPGRFERIAVDPEIIVDGAHNVDSIERLVETLDERRQGRNLVVVLGVARDKDLAGMISVLARLDANVVATASHNPRAVEPAEIVRLATEAGLQASATEATSDAIAIAREEAGADGMVCITGSLYVVAEAREALGLAQTPAFERSLLYR